MNWKDIRTLYLRELRSAMRERGIVVYSIIIPVVLYPLLMWLVYTAFSYANGQAAELKSHVMVRTIPEAHQALRRALQEDRAIDVDFSETPRKTSRRATSTSSSISCRYRMRRRLLKATLAFASPTTLPGMRAPPREPA